MSKPHARSHSTAPLAAVFSAICAAVAVGSPSAAAEEDGFDFFERRIRPLLIERCLKCHAGEKARAGLRLDSREGWAEGGRSGPAIVPGAPEESLLIRAVRWSDDELKMPPKERLAPAEVALLERWVAGGAPDPRRGEGPGPGGGAEGQHWAYRPPVAGATPAVRDAAWPRTEIDAYILAALEARGIPPAPDADRAALARRASFDLTGLPPSPEELAAFLADDSPEAFERFADRLIASPRFGERLARRWFDVARFAQSVSLRGFVFKEAWRYRDYVIGCFNEDVPFDRFIREQVAGDLLPGGGIEERRRRLIATAFLAMGDWNLEEQDKKQLEMDIVDEQLDTIGKAFLAQTIGCARCHDHKFDPIPARDYYALAGILRSTQTVAHANVSNWLEMPLPLEPEAEEALRRHEAALAALQAELEAARKALGGATARAGAIAPGELPGIVVDSAAARAVGEWVLSQHTKPYVGDGYLHDGDGGKGAKTLTFQPELPLPGRYEVRIAYTPGANRAGEVPVTVFHAGGEATVRIDQRRPPAIDGLFVSLGAFRFEQNGFAHVLVSNEGTRGHVIADAVQFLPADAEPVPPATRSPEDDARGAGLAARVQALEGEIKKLAEGGPRRPVTLSVKEAEAIEDAPIHLRGSVQALGEKVPRGFLTAATLGEPPDLPAGESGRRQLADWIAGPSNPLAARVIVNRVWSWLLGEGLVRTPDNFGVMGEAPSHAELLDRLALRFIEEGWSIKKLVRSIIISRVYGLAGAAGAGTAGARLDPENRLLWRAHRKRLDAESLRDAILAASGRLDLAMCGPNLPADLASEYGYRFTSSRRSVYLPALRNQRLEVFEAFDAPSPSTVTGRRAVTTVPAQALFFLNDPFVEEEAAAAARRLLRQEADDDAVILERAYRLILGRLPAPAEATLALEHLAAARREDSSRLQAWSDICHALFGSIDFRYLE
jgi:hypothetical protein